jgi:hypothetical protein
VGYGLHTFLTSTPLRLRFDRLDKLHVAFTDCRDRNLEVEESAPTLVWLELCDMDGFPDQFTITANSRQDRLYPANEPAQFAVPLDDRMELGTRFEVALVSLVYPPNLKEDTLAYLWLNKRKVTFDLNDYATTDAFVEAVKNETRHATEGRVSFGVMESGPARGQAFFRRRAAAGYEPTIIINTCERFTRACGQTHRPRAATSLRPGRMVVFFGSPNIHLGRPHPMAMLQCDIVQPVYMCGKDRPLLQCVPVITGVESNRSRVYEPPVLTYHTLNPWPFTTIHFTFTEPDGSYRHFTTDNQELGVQVTLSFRRRKCQYEQHQEQQMQVQ